MAKIKQLSPLEAQNIAACEAVDRPANVVKELIENALDAGATDITLHLEEGGKKLIRVVDNGCGMSPEDAHMALRHHATSKITSVDDLEHIQTYGFRGEALSSIAAVSRLILTTKEEAALSGTSLTIVQGTIEQESVVAHNTGTDIAVHDLFFNIPARKKFLKTKETEWRAIAHLFHALSLTYQQVSFKVYHDQRLVYTVPAAQNLSDRLAQLFEPALSKNSLLIHKTQERMNVKVWGAITESSYVRYDRSHIFVFVNNRWVKNHKLTQALIKGYQGMLPPQRYPAGFLFISLDPVFVDINIHPRKEEVQFLHPRIVEDLIEAAVQEQLEERHAQQLGASRVTPTIKSPARFLNEPIISTFGLRPAHNYPANQHDEKQKQTFLDLLDRNFSPSLDKLNTQQAPTQAAPQSGPQHMAPEQSLIEQPPDAQIDLAQPHGGHLKSAAQRASELSPEPAGEQSESSQLAETSSEPLALEQSASETTEHERLSKDGKHATASSIGSPEPASTIAQQQSSLNYRLIGQLQATYIMIETQEGLVLIDQHAAHERIIYERLRTRFDEVARIRLLFPQIISLTRDDVSLFEPYLEILLHFGIDAQRLSDHEIAIQETPVFLKNQSLEESLKQAISVLHEYQYLDHAELKKIMHERVHAHLSCKAAIKAGDELSTASMHELIKDLYSSDNKLTCPHGRPTLWQLGTSDIQKRFKRDYR